MKGASITVIAGPFAGMQGTVLSLEGDNLKAEILVFGRSTTVDLKREQVDGLGRPDLDAALREHLERVRVDEASAWWHDRAYGAENAEPADEWQTFVAWQSAQKAQRDVDGLAAQLAKAAAEWTSAASVRTWLEKTIPRPQREPPAVQQARAEQRVTASGTPKLSDAQWKEVFAWRQAGILRRQNARLAEALRASNHPDDQTLERQRQAALDDAQTLAPAVRDRYNKSHGLHIPDHAFRCWAFFRALTPLEREAIDYVGISLGALYERFEYDLTPRDGLDHRLNGRFYQAPPELLHALWGDSDGLHWGLWYDTGDETDPVVGGFYARDGGGGFMTSSTLLGVVRDRIDDMQDSLAYEAEDERERIEIYVHVLEAALAWFEPERDPLERDTTLTTVDGFDIVLPCGAGSLPDHGDVQLRWDQVRDDWPAVQRWADLARDELAQDRPARALLLGRDLHWLSLRDTTREALAGEMLVSAYEALGRGTLAEIARAHSNKGRRLDSVGIYPSRDLV